MTIQAHGLALQAILQSHSQSTSEAKGNGYSQQSLWHGWTWVWISCLVLLCTACGGGGGSVQNAPTSPNITINGGATVYDQESASFSAASTDPTGLAITYSWSFGDGSAAVAGASATHSYATAGTYVVQATATNSAHASSQASVQLTVMSGAPSAPTVVLNGGKTVYTTQSVDAAAISTDPRGLSLGYVWNFGDGTAAAAGQSPAHTYSAGGNYTVSVTATNTANRSATATQQIVVQDPVPSTPSVTASAGAPYVSQAVTFNGSATDPLKSALTYNWNFGDGSTASGASVSHAFASAGIYNVSLVAKDALGFSSSATTTAVTVLSHSANVLTVDCAGSNCGALSPSSYSGTGVGTWRYDNASSTAATVSINISGVKSGQTATLVMSNGTTANASQTPSFGTLNSPVASVVNSSSLRSLAQWSVSQDAMARAHADLMAKNRAVVQKMKQASAIRSNTSLLPTQVQSTQPMATPAVGDTRIWNDLYNSTNVPIQYSTRAAAVCSLPSGRHVVFWLDPNAKTASNVTDADITAMQAAVCSSGAGFDQLNQLLGDVWGTLPATYSNVLIQDAPSSKQDIHIAIVNAPNSTGWAGYFYAVNNLLKSNTQMPMPNSNEALVFFVNASQIRANRPYAISTLLHEATHMTNFYQKYVVRGTDHETWLEETSAMMSEDIVAPGVNAGYDTGVSVRIPGYLYSGGAVDYMGWTTLSANSYNMGGSFGLYLNRRYGLSIYQQLITNCNDGTAGTDSYACLDALIKANGGIGFSDEFAHFGASMFSVLPLSSTVERYGLSNRTDGSYALAAVDMSTLARFLSASPASLTSAGLTKSTQIYAVDHIASSVPYSRSNVVVPAGTTLLVVIH